MAIIKIKFFTSCAYHAGKVGYDALMIVGGGVIQIATQISDVMSAVSQDATPGRAAASSGKPPSTYLN